MKCKDTFLLLKKKSPEINSLNSINRQLFYLTSFQLAFYFVFTYFLCCRMVTKFYGIGLFFLRFVNTQIILARIMFFFLIYSDISSVGFFSSFNFAIGRIIVTNLNCI